MDRTRGRSGHIGAHPELVIPPACADGRAEVTGCNVLRDDAERALSFVKRFGSVTVLNGHIHQVMQKVEGNITFHTARGTAFPLPTPGSVPKPLPVVVDAPQLKKMLGLTSVNYTETNHTLAVVDSTLG